MKTMIRRQAAFTLVELLMVMVVLAVIAAIVIPKFAGRQLEAQDASLKSDLNLLRNAIASYQADTGYYPTALSDLTATTAPADGCTSAGPPCSSAITASNWHGPYLATAVPTDPVSGTAFNYDGATNTGSLTAVGNVGSSMTGNDPSGVAYSTY